MSASPAVDSLVVPWAVQGLGFRGTIQVDRQWMPKQQWDGATVRDLLACVESRLDPTEGLVMVSLSLFGARLKPNDKLTLLLPALAAPFPCVLAAAKPASASSMIEFTIKPLTTSVWTIKCSVESTIKEVKQLLYEQEGVPAGQQRLVHAGLELEDHVQLKQYGVEDGDTLPMVLRLRGGGVVSVPFANVADNSLLTEITFSGNAPDWRRCDEGLNIEGRYGLPICYKKITPVTCGFYNCEWAFQGVRSSDGMRMSSPWKSAEGHRYHCFDASETSGSIEWASLLITTKPLHTFLPTASGPRSCIVCADSLESTEPEVVRVAACGHRFHQSCCADLTKTQLAMGALCTCPSCGNPIDDQ